MRFKKFILFIAPIVALLVFTDPALAVTHAGEGLYGPTNDSAITNMMFFLIAFFPGVIILASLYQAWSERRRHRKWATQQAERAAHPPKTGW